MARFAAKLPAKVPINTTTHSVKYRVRLTGKFLLVELDGLRTKQLVLSSLHNRPRIERDTRRRVSGLHELTRLSPHVRRRNTWPGTVKRKNRGGLIKPPRFESG